MEHPPCEDSATKQVQKQTGRIVGRRRSMCNKMMRLSFQIGAVLVCLNLALHNDSLQSTAFVFVPTFSRRYIGDGSASKQVMLLQDKTRSTCATTRIYLTAPTSPTVGDSSSSSSSSGATMDSSADTNDDNIVNDDDPEYIEPTDGDALQALFSRFCDLDGLMTFQTLKSKVPQLLVLLEDEELLESELKSIWNATPKFPAVVENGEDQEEVEDRIDVDGFVKIYRDVDDLFEDEGTASVDKKTASKSLVAVDAPENGVQSSNKQKKTSEKNDTTTPTKSSKGAKSATNNKGSSSKTTKSSSASTPLLDEDEMELEQVFTTLCAKSNSNGQLSKQDILQWEEIVQLFTDGLLSKKEFEIIWDETPKKKQEDGSKVLDLEGFLRFNDKLDDLFDFDEDDEDDDKSNVSPKEAPKTKENAAVASTNKEKKKEPIRVIYDDDVESLFTKMASTPDLLLTRGQLEASWGDLKDMLSDGDLLLSELDEFFEKIPKAATDPDKIDLQGFQELKASIDDLFEEDEDEKEEKPAASSVAPPPKQVSNKDSLLRLLQKLEDMASSNVEFDLLPCGLEADEKTQADVLKVVSVLEKDQTTNSILMAGQTIGEADLAGEWELLYTSSSMMKFNKGLSGLGGSFPNGKFGGLKQTLVATRQLQDVEYTERIIVNPESRSFDVTVNGSWDLKQSISLLTGAPTISISVEPDKVKYGPTNTRADHWKSVRAMNLLDLTYLDDDIRIMRGTTSTDTLFILRRV